MTGRGVVLQLIDANTCPYMDAKCSATHLLQSAQSPHSFDSTTMQGAIQLSRRRLPPCTTSIHTQCTDMHKMSNSINFKEFCKKIEHIKRTF